MRSSGSYFGARGRTLSNVFFIAVHIAVAPTLVAVLASIPKAVNYSMGDKFGIFLVGLPIPVSQMMMEERHVWLYHVYFTVQRAMAFSF